jgi:CHAT domain-containing protein
MQSPAFGRPHGERAAALAESLGRGSDQALALVNLSALAAYDNDRSGAERLARRALETGAAAGDSAAVHGAAVELGELAIGRGDREGEWSWYSRAEAAGRTLGLDVSLGDRLNLAIAHVRRGELDAATSILEQNLETASEADYPQGEWEAMLGLGDVAEKRGAFSEALVWDRRAAARVDTLRGRAGSESGSVSVLARRRFVFEALIHLLGKLDPARPDSGWAAEGFGWSERAKARAFLDLLGATEGRATAVAPLTLAEARARLGRSDALLAYSVGDSSTSLWVITPRAWKHVALPPRGVLRARVEVLRRSLADPASAESPRARAAARALDSLLIEPARPWLRGVRHLVIAPDDALALIPFEVLLSRPVSGARVPAGSYLVERFAISYVPSATALATLRAPSPQARGIVALGNPTFAASAASPGGARTAALAPLPHTAEEVAALQALAKGRPFFALTGADATRGRLLALPALPAAELIHLATHGEANEAEPRRSGLWLAGGGEGDPFLSVADILDLRLAAELVTLSACETGLGRLERGEGVMGLTRAFLAAGARSVVVSLWQVNDRSTAELMRRFYATLLTRGAPREVALASAKRALLADPATRSPYHWAPFVLVGAGGRVP